MGDRSGLGFVEGMLVGMNRSRQAQAAGARSRVFDWDTAARTIRERQPQRVEAGLSGDWAHTGGPIYENGAIVPREETYTYLQSNWAVPKMILDEEDIPCWRYADEVEWDESTYWPESARRILAGEDTP